MKNNTETARNPNDLLHDLHALVAEAEKLVGQSASEATAETINALRARYEAAQERIGELYAGARKRVVAG
ncbi:MAG TPA: hypothetical protein VHN79_03005, partial [Lacunisphaera sp.]|nr:hypothetical protein [Lacunisphaera sp.]